MLKIPSGMTSAVSLRPFAIEDESALACLIDDDSDPLWVAQGHRLHGPARDGERWRRTLLADSDGRLVGAGTIARNRIHPGRYNLAIEVAAPYRRRGIGGVLLAALRELRPEPLPLATKLRESDPAAMAFLRTGGGRVYQRCPAVRPIPASAEITDWCRHQLAPTGTELVSPAGVSQMKLAEFFGHQYLWMHEQWSPADPGPLRELAQDMVAEADPGLSVLAVHAGGVAAIAWAFPEGDGSVTIVCETLRRDTPEGVPVVAAALARCLQKLAAAGISRVELDGHVTDPHLAPVVDTLPAQPSDPLLLVEF